MSEWQKVKIGDFLKRIKRPVVLEDEKEYKLVTIQLHHKGVKLRGHKKGNEIKSKMYEVKVGDFILSGIDARNGAFGIVGDELDGAIVTNDFWYFRLNEGLIDKHFFLELTSTKWFDEICRLGSDGTTQRIRLQKTKFFNQEIYLPSVDKQKEVSKKFISIKQKKEGLEKECSSQKSILTLLRQQVLQDAISGKLTEDWRAENPITEPASRLLEQINAEKEKLIAEKKIKKEKSLPKIADDEVPFELPEGWGWCRLGEIKYLSEYGTSQKADLNTKGVPVLAMGNIFNGKVILNAKKNLSLESSDLPRLLLKKDDLLFNRTNSWELVGKTGVYEGEDDEYTFASYLIRLRFFEESISPYFVNLYLNTRIFRETQIEPQIVQQCGQANFNGSKLANTIFPLPPRAEQRAIVAKVGRLMEYVSQLEEKIAQNANNAETLMQVFLGEVFQSQI